MNSNGNLCNSSVKNKTINQLIYNNDNNQTRIPSTFTNQLFNSNRIVPKIVEYQNSNNKNVECITDLGSFSTINTIQTADCTTTTTTTIINATITTTTTAKTTTNVTYTTANTTNTANINNNNNSDNNNENNIYSSRSLTCVLLSPRDYMRLSTHGKIEHTKSIKPILNSCSNSPHKIRDEQEVKHLKRISVSPQLDRPSENSICTMNRQNTSESMTQCNVLSTNNSKHGFQSLENSPLMRLKHNQLFTRLWKHARIRTRSASVSQNSSPALDLKTQSLKHNLNIFNTNQNDQNLLIQSSNVKLVDTCLIKQSTGFGLTLTGIITFIPNGLINYTPISNCLDYKYGGFYQRLLQIKSVSDSTITYSNNNILQTTSKKSIKPGDILLAAGGYRLAGCTPEYAVELLSNIPIGGIIQITLLRGLNVQPNLSSTNNNKNNNNNIVYNYNQTPDLICNNSEQFMKKNHSKYDELKHIKTNPSLVLIPSDRKQYSKNITCSICNNNYKYLRSVYQMKENDGFGLEFIRTDQGYLVNQINKNPYASKDENSLQIGDIVIKFENFDYHKLTENEIVQLFENFPVGKVISFLVIRNCSQCQRKYTNIPNLSNANLSLTVQSEKAHLTSENSRFVNTPEMMQYLRTVFNSNNQSKRLSTPNIDLAKQNVIYKSINSNSATITSWLPEDSIEPGIGIGGPCETPDYVPATQFVNQNKYLLKQFVPSNTMTNIRNDNQLFPNLLISSNESERKCLLNINNTNQPPSYTYLINSNNSQRNTHSIPENPIQTEVKIKHDPNYKTVQIFKEAVGENLPKIVSVSSSNPNQSNSNLVVGDVLVAIENQSVLNSSLEKVEHQLKQATITVGRSSNPQNFTHEHKNQPDSLTSEKINGYSNIIEVKLTRKPEEGFGFVIVSSLNNERASEIGRIIPNSPADKSGQLEVGQRILAINGNLLTGINHMDIVKLIRQSQQELCLTVEKPNKQLLFTSSNVDLSKQIDSNLSDNFDSTALTTSIEENLKMNPTNIDQNLIKSDNLQNSRKQNLIQNKSNSLYSDPMVYSTVLDRGPNGFGFSVRGGSDIGGLPLFVFRISEDGPAFRQGLMQTGDEILEINKQNTQTMTHEQAVHLLRSTESQVQLLLKHVHENHNENTV